MSTPSRGKGSHQPAIPADAADAVLRFVRGKASWRSLERVGIYVELKDEGCEIDNPWEIVVNAAAGDIAEGLLAHRDDPQELVRWARIVMGGSGFINLNALEQSAQGDVLLNALWDAMDGDLSEDAIKAAESVPGRQPPK